MYHLITEEWQGRPISFRQEDAWVNLTEMCGAFGRRPAKFLELPSTKAYLEALEKEATAISENRTLELPENPTIKFVETRRGGDTSNAGKAGIAPGTWAHPDLAIECARWLSPEFSIRCNRIIRRLLAGEPVKAAPLTRAQRRLRKQRLKLRGSELREEVDAVRRQLEAMRASEDVPGHVAVREWLAGEGRVLSHGDTTRVSLRLSKEARRGEITAGEKTLATKTLARAARVPTYPPEAIAAAVAALPLELPCG